jgi:hypothetical protein
MRPLEEILKDYEELRSSFKNFTSVGDANNGTLLEYQQRFLELKADLRPWHTKMMHASEMRSDKQSTAIKHRIGLAMVRNEYEFKDGETPMYEKPPTITNSEKYAAATKEYKQFLEQRAFYKESFVNVADLREDLQGFITLCRDRQNK